MIAVEPTTATGSGDSPASIAGSMNFVSASSVTPMPTSANSPRRRATSTTSTAKAIASAVSGKPALEVQELVRRRLARRLDADHAGRRRRPRCRRA